ncbi:tRNA delta(2)-isopentenylpyrophosphate transferase [Handroanthus impetiginosus]|uniref:adenylate dimethylallyltransferase (ADP/ATP-dependent) n=1 Tax=Handroanthus impetiginosus TaxID=429701 RepID=A0A2G9G3V6_9LAMI|nr:tRNA delta(2)-isopentenylpyrophosphate transferase [Handroanthus impetiginosus]PIN01763.1 tRNA delta(2)-isopentenylpyrophosphate transferase [Handroanthus impetiginosus]
MACLFSLCMQPTTFTFINKDKLVRPSKDKVAVIMGTTGTGKSRLSIDLATIFGGEIINSDKIQIHKGLNVISNKVTDEERRRVPHYLLGIIDPDDDFKAHDFVYHASLTADAITKKGHLPIIAGGSNSFIKALVIDDIEFQSKYECCYLWVDVPMPILHPFLEKRVDKMVERMLVDESREFFNPKGDYTHGIRRSIGVPEMDEYFRKEKLVDSATRAKLLAKAIHQIKENTCKLASRQLRNILRLAEQLEWQIHRLEATEAFLRSDVEANEAWETLVLGPSIKILAHFLNKKTK